MATGLNMLGGAYLHAEPQAMIELEMAFKGGWTPRLLPKVRPPEKPKSSGGGKRPGRARSLTPLLGVPRIVRIAEPRSAPRPQSSLRHHHFEQRTILASAKGNISVAERRAAYGEGFNAPDALITAEVRATNEASYTEGNKSTGAERVVYVTATNGDSYDDRMRFWDLANENAHFVGEHTITVMTRNVEKIWDQAARNPTMPDSLREAVAKAKADPKGTATITVNDAGVVKRWLAKRTKSFPAELLPHVALETPKNGRTAYSIVGQFPHDMSLSGMRGTLDQLVAEFTVRNIPCQAVIHEPTVKNSEKNWHFHLLYYAGEAERLEGGRWSFEREKVRDKWRTTKWVPLKRLPRNTEVAADDWVPKLKRRWSEIVNARAIAEGIATRFTNETNEERGLAKAQTRYTPGRQALHKQGYFTDRDIEDNFETWRDWRHRRKDQLRKKMQSLRDFYERRRADPRLAQVEILTREKIGNDLRRVELMFDDVDMLIDAAAQAEMLRKIVMSGPKDVIVHYADVRDSIKKRRLTPARAAKLTFAEEVCAVAQNHVAALEPTRERLARIQGEALTELDGVYRELLELSSQIDKQIDAGSAERTSPSVSVDRSEIASVPVVPLRSQQALAAHLASGSSLNG